MDKSLIKLLLVTSLMSSELAKDKLSKLGIWQLLDRKEVRI